MRQRTNQPARGATLSASGLLARTVFVGSLLLLVVACGGGGDGPPAADEEVIIDGFSGRVLLPDSDLGRICEQEPNGALDRAFRLAPLSPRCALEVAGHMGVSAAQFGAVDLSDVLLFSSAVDQRIALELNFESLDPLNLPVPNELLARVFDAATGAELAATAPGSQPLTLSFDAVADAAYHVAISITSGHAWYVVRFTGSDLPAALLKTAPAGSSPVASASGDDRSPPSAGAGAPRPEPLSLPPSLEEGSGCAATHVLVRFREGRDPASVCAEHGLRLGRRTATGSYRVRFDCAAEHGSRERTAAEQCERLAEDPGVLWAEPDWRITSLGLPNDAEFGRQWNMHAIGAPSAWDVETGDSSIIIGVVDSGIIAHPDLADRLVDGYDFVSDPDVAGDGDGRDPDPTDPGDRFGNSGLSSWHGTHVAGLIVGKQDDTYGISGVAPGCRVMPLRALGIGGGFVSDAADAILYAAGLYTTADGRVLSQPVSILNLSVGLAQDSADLRDACERATNQGVLLVGAVGNTGGAVLYPAAYPSVLAVAAVDGQLLTTGYSSFGPQVDIAAPGGLGGADQWNDGWMDGVLSAVMDETVEPAVFSHGYLVGTSQAAPHVAGAAALLLSLNPNLSATNLKTILKGTALDLGVPGDDLAYGSGLLQIHKAIKNVMAIGGPERGDAPYLMLPTQSMQFDGLRTSLVMPLYNGGGGTLNLFFAIPRTDDGAPWLSASMHLSTHPSPPVNNDTLTVQVDRGQLPATPGRYAGTVVLGNSAGTLASIRVVLYVQERSRVGQSLPIVAIEEATSIARRKAFARPENGYRYWIRGMPEGAYTLQAGEDLDSDGFFCEAADACGWLGGPTEADAVLVPFVAGDPAIAGLRILLAPPR